MTQRVLAVGLPLLLFATACVDSGDPTLLEPTVETPPVSAALTTLAATGFVVNTRDDISDGVCGAAHCNLREAIHTANNTPGADLITFSIPDGPPYVIQPSSPLPAIVGPVTIDGTTQPGFSGGPVVELNGSSAGTNFNSRGLNFRAGSDGSTVRGLVIRGFFGIAIETFFGSHTIEGNYLGTDVTGTVADGNSLGLSLRSSRNVVSNNVISGNRFGGVNVSPWSGNPVADNNVIRDNLIGVNPTAATAVPNGGDGILLLSSGGNEVVGNLVSGNTGVGVNVSASYPSCLTISPNVIQDNIIGLDAAGTTFLGNQVTGVQSFANGTLIGGAGVGNVISGHTGPGVNVFCQGNVIQGNRIGTDASGMSAVANFLGVFVQDAGTVIGGTVPGAGNLISGNRDNGIDIRRGDATIQGNLIGTNAGGVDPLPNGGRGVLIHEVAAGGVLGGTTPGAGNIVAYHTGHGVQVLTGTLAILSNSIYANGLLGINLGSDFFTFNDPGDADTGPNGLQNFPVLLAAETLSSTTVTGTLSSAPGDTFRIELFDNEACGLARFGQGEIFVASGEVTTDATGDASFSLTTTPPIPSGRFITATATDADGNTSEFSRCLEVVSPVITVDLDIKPDSDPNSINTMSKGVIPVAILGSADFIVNDVDLTTLTFGPSGATPAHSAGGHVEDVNDDGFDDLVSHYRTQDSGLSAGDMVACVDGATTSGTPIHGCDAVRIVR